MSWLLIIHAYFYVLPPFWMIYTADLTALRFVLLVWEHKQVCTNFNILSYGFCGLIKNIWFIYCFHWLILYVCLNLHKLVSIKIFHVFNPSLTFNRKSCRELRSLDPRLPKPKPPFCASQPQSIIVEHIQRVHILVITPKWMYNGKRKRKSVWPTWLTDNPNEDYITCVGQSISDLTQKMHDYFLCRMGPFSGVTSGSLWKKPAFISAVADSSHLKPNQQPSFSSEYLAPCYSDWLIHSLARVNWGGDVVNTWMCYKVLILHPMR